MSVANFADKLNSSITHANDTTHIYHNHLKHNHTVTPVLYTQVCTFSLLTAFHSLLYYSVMIFMKVYGLSAGRENAGH